MANRLIFSGPFDVSYKDVVVNHSIVSDVSVKGPDLSINLIDNADMSISSIALFGIRKDDTDIGLFEIFLDGGTK